MRRSQTRALRPFDVTDTIVATATPAGVGGLAIVRLSGPKTFAILNRLLPGQKLSRQPSHTVRLLWLKDEKGEPVDQVMVTVFRKPRSYTGEHMAEITCHGSPLISEKITDLCRKNGCRLAEPGEFTRRAVLNGKLTLSQAEAILALVNATSPPALHAAIAAYQGGTTRYIADLGINLRDLYSDVEYLLGFDENECPDLKAIKKKTSAILSQINRIIKKAARNRFLFEPARVAIVGRTNVGKSSLFNRLLQDERAITSPFPGTTRDRIEATVTAGSVKINLIDTCGYDPKSKNPLTRQGTIQTRKAIKEADLLILVFDGSQPANKHDRTILAETEKKPKIYVINKSDLARGFNPALLPGSALWLSCKTGEGLSRLRTILRRHLQPVNRPSPLITRRQIEVLNECRANLLASLTSPDLATRATEIRFALESLAKIDSPLTPEDILNRIFARFCVGK
ncbi:MAG: tRNA uridine-5-carboxymethylaminomethyl(34) synthesis GTPase MnmE [bacterium]